MVSNTADGIELAWDPSKDRSDVNYLVDTRASDRSEARVCAAGNSRPRRSSTWRGFDVFDTLATGEEVAAHKPDPEVYLLALDRFGVDGDSAIAVEDKLAAEVSQPMRLIRRRRRRSRGSRLRE
ncbi:HAD hydrolase-like protein [Actinopolymorpha sp. NPDC004070]|uniref:HAD hydrolase-like protein n=1 Tax=Actinopolymorpha sp. NPDC004070 TaxID=3154548 RepID=UPI0033AFD209